MEEWWKVVFEFTILKLDRPFLQVVDNLNENSLCGISISDNDVLNSLFQIYIYSAYIIIPIVLLYVSINLLA